MARLHIAHMSAETSIIVSDAHIGHADWEESRASFHRFLHHVPDLGHQLVINGDMFDFWFEYSSVIPRDAYPTLTAISRVVESGVKVVITGGNHDRWGGRFWREQMGAEFHPRTAELELAGFRSLVDHGDGSVEPEMLSRLLSRVINHRVTAATFRAIHPDVGFWLVRRLGPVLNRRDNGDSATNQAALNQALHARALLDRRAELELVVFGHTHRAALEEVSPGRWYLNPGAWKQQHEYAVVTPEGPQLKRFEG